MGADNFLKQRALIGGLFDNSEEDAMNELQQNKALMAGIGLPELSEYRPDDYQYVGDYDPTKAQSTEIKEDPQLRARQESVLNELAGLSHDGLSDVDKAGFDQARRTGEGVISSANGAALQNAQARGVAGSGMEMALRAQAAQAGAERAQQAGLQQASDSARQRALYEQAYGQAAAGVRGQDYTASAANANILNQFNMANTNTQNQAQQQNLANHQAINNQNTAEHNQAQLTNNQIKQQGFQNQVTKATGQQSAGNAMATGYAAQNAANAKARDQDFSNAMSIAGMFTGGAGGGGKKAGA